MLLYPAATMGDPSFTDLFGMGLSSGGGGASLAVDNLRYPAATMGDASFLALFGGSASGGGTIITPTLALFPPLLAIPTSPLISSSATNCAPYTSNGGFMIGINELGVTVYISLYHSPNGAQVPAPIAGATFTLELKDSSGNIITMVSTPTLVYALFGWIQFIFQQADMQLLTVGTYRGAVRAVLSDGQVRDFTGLQFSITGPVP